MSVRNESALTRRASRETLYRSLAALGQKDEADAILTRLEEESPRHYVLRAAAQGSRCADLVKRIGIKRAESNAMC